ncbi:MAG TPA: DUF167 domain-containing protein [bacterium]|nr:DUF167 domain-containing protein [bacterium]HOL48614.1 DUF167 domain-containing protein [bacterium]HPQ19048.1 DUF167 domain-containing protein [bacterium]
MRIEIKVIANAKKEEIIKTGENEYKVKVSAPAIENKANKRLLQILADYFNTNISNIKIIKGEKTNKKILEIN